MASRLRLIILGAPGSGKGTISNRIVKEFKVSHLSSGDLLRSHIKNKTEIGIKAKNLVAQGQLVSDELITKIFLHELEKLNDKSWLIDGFPRTLSQCKALDHSYADRVINLNVPFDVIINRLKHRWIHPGSGRIYNLEFNPPKVKGKDDVTGEKLIQRSDDQESVVLARLKAYEKQFQPVIDYYATKKILEEFTGSTSDYLWPLIKKSLHDFSQISVQSYSNQASAVKETPTHTGQAYEVDDFRRDRFENARQVVNEKFAIDLVKEDPIVVCEQRSVWSSGGGAMGHPKIFINLDKDKVHICGYSGRRFIKKKFYNEMVHGKSILHEQYLEEMKRKEAGEI